MKRKIEDIGDGIFIACYGPHEGSWRILNRENPVAFDPIASRVFKHFKVTELWMPSPIKFNAHIAEESEFDPEKTVTTNFGVTIRQAELPRARG